MGSFSKKRIDVTIILAINPNNPAALLFRKPTFRDDDNVITLQGYRVSADCKNVGALGQGTQSQFRIFGMKQADMNRLSMLTWGTLSNQLNQIVVSAGDDNGMTDIFGGCIINAWADYTAAPDVCLVIRANPAYFHQTAPAAPTSTQGATAVADLMKDLAGKMGRTLINNGVDSKLSATYLSGTLMKQAQTVAQSAGLLMVMDHQTMSISPANKPLVGEIPIISAESGLIGYPAWSQVGISFNCLFNPSIQFGGQVIVQSDIDVANGQWFVKSLHYQLESERVGGAWFCQVEGGKTYDQPQ
jgi:hypothetical protein